MRPGAQPTGRIPGTFPNVVGGRQSPTPTPTGTPLGFPTRPDTPLIPLPPLPRVPPPNVATPAPGGMFGASRGGIDQFLRMLGLIK